MTVKAVTIKKVMKKGCGILKNTLQKAKKKIRKEPIRKAVKKLKKGGKKVLEIGLLLDYTGSMATWIKRAKDTLNDFI